MKGVYYDDILEAILSKIQDKDDPYHAVRIAIRKYVDHPYPASGLYDIIVSHAFATALWDEDWLAHLKEMVGYKIALEYLKRFF